MNIFFIIQQTEKQLHTDNENRPSVILVPSLCTCQTHYKLLCEYFSTLFRMFKLTSGIHATSFNEDQSNPVKGRITGGTGLTAISPIPLAGQGVPSNTMHHWTPPPYVPHGIEIRRTL